MCSHVNCYSMTSINSLVKYCSDTEPSDIKCLKCAKQLGVANIEFWEADGANKIVSVGLTPGFPLIAAYKDGFYCLHCLTTEKHGDSASIAKKIPVHPLTDNMLKITSGKEHFSTRCQFCWDTHEDTPILMMPCGHPLCAECFNDQEKCGTCKQENFGIKTGKSWKEEVAEPTLPTRYQTSTPVAPPLGNHVIPPSSSNFVSPSLGNFVLPSLVGSNFMLPPIFEENANTCPTMPVLTRQTSAPEVQSSLTPGGDFDTPAGAPIRMKPVYERTRDRLYGDYKITCKRVDPQMDTLVSAGNGSVFVSAITEKKNSNYNDLVVFGYTRSDDGTYNCTLKRNFRNTGYGSSCDHCGDDIQHRFSAEGIRSEKLRHAVLIENPESRNVKFMFMDRHTPAEDTDLTSVFACQKLQPAFDKFAKDITNTDGFSAHSFYLCAQVSYVRGVTLVQMSPNYTPACGLVFLEDGETPLKKTAVQNIATFTDPTMMTLWAVVIHE